MIAGGQTMGGDGSFLVSGGFDRQVYQFDQMVDGIKVIVNPQRKNDSLPKFSNTPHTAYLRRNSEGEITQIRFYRGRRVKADIDWGHGHGKDCPRGTPHYHVWKTVKDATGRSRSGVHLERQDPRPLKEREWKIPERILREAGYKGGYR